MEGDFDMFVVEGHRVLRCRGPVDLASRAEFLHALWRLSVADERSVVVDLTHVTYLDSGGVEGLYTLSGVLQPGHTLTVVCPDGPVRQALTFMDFDETNHVVETLRSFASVSRTKHDDGAG